MGEKKKKIMSLKSHSTGNLILGCLAFLHIEWTNLMSFPFGNMALEKLDGVFDSVLDPIC